MKRTLLLLLMMLFAFCAQATDETDIWAVEEASMLVQRMSRLAAEPGYLELYASEPKLIEHAKEMSVLRDAAPLRAGIIDVDELWMLDMFLESSTCSNEARTQLMQKLPASIRTILIGMSGAEQLAAATVLTQSDIYVAPEGFVPCVLLLDYGKDVCAIASYTIYDQSFAFAEVSFAQIGIDELSEFSMIPMRTIDLSND